MRVRQQGEIHTVYGPTTVGPCSPLSLNHVVGKSGQLTTTTDVVVPDFHIRSAQGEIFNNPFRKEVENHSTAWTPYSVRAINGCSAGVDKEYDGFYGSAVQLYNHGITSLPSTDNLRVLASTSAAASIAAPDVSSMIELAELPEAVGLMKHPLDQARYVINDAKQSKTRIARGVSIARFIADNWLAYRYGLVPAASSLSSAMEVIKGRAEKRFPRMTARGYASSGLYQDTSVHTPVNGTFYSADVHTDHTFIADCRAGFLYELNLTSFSPWGSLHQWPSTAVELVTYSFLLDWFINVSAWASSLEIKPGTTVLSAWTTLRTAYTRQSEVAFNWKSPANHVEDSAPSLQFDTTLSVVDRKPGSRRGLALEPNPFGLRDVPNFNRMADSLSLIIAQLR